MFFFWNALQLSLTVLLIQYQGLCYGFCCSLPANETLIQFGTTGRKWKLRKKKWQIVPMRNVYGLLKWLLSNNRFLETVSSAIVYFFKVPCFYGTLNVSSLPPPWSVDVCCYSVSLGVLFSTFPEAE